MDTEETESGVTLGEICRIILRKIWIILGVSVAGAVIAALCAIFVLDHTVYHLSFRIAYPGSETSKYPDGSRFYYSDIISLKSMEEAKKSDEAFSKINVQKMYENDAVSITAEKGLIEGVYWEVGTFTVAIPASYFSDRNQATAFIRALANLPVQYARDAAARTDFDSNLEAYRTVPSFEMKLGYLKEQKNALLAQYDEWISLYGENYRNRATGKTLKAYRTEVNIAFTDVVQANLQKDLELNGYVPVSSLEEQKKNLQTEKASNSAKIRSLMAQWEEIRGGSTEMEMPLPLAEEISKLSVRNAQIDNELDALSDANLEKTKENIKAFETQLNGVAEKLASVTETLNSVSVSLYNQEATVRFQTSKAVEEGGSSVVLITAAGFIAAFVIACIIVYIIEAPKYRRARAIAEAVADEENKDGGQN